ncbi:phage tail protein [Xenorhabdus sp. XENO-1]|uniref:tail fiber protein n=1 Tax=Xenorhabdus bovienii TaxID=40576 RepID=UPI0020CA8FCA|nr:tail fiber protein [Xenorhabdus bovienii]MCP9268469.1 phage tail protein [Xenorhabdus bovienii subsp. africana]
MKEIRYSATVQEQQTLSDTKVVGSETDKLKDKFKDGSIPLQTDFNQLIDIADIGRKACGQSPQQNGPGKGLKLDDSGTLSLKMGTISSQDFSPLILEKDILSVDLGSGLINNSNGISVGQGNGIVVNKNDVAVNLAANKGLIVEPNGIAIKPGNGIQFDSSGALASKPADSTITVDSSGIKVKIKTDRGINVDDGLQVYLHKNGGIGYNSEGICIKTGNGIKIDNDRVAVDPNTVLPKGMIVMFSGSTLPQGWALCDGSNGTPNLIDRFILGGKISDINSKNNATLSGSGNNKKCNKNSDNKVVSVNVKIKDTALTLSQMPKHEHTGGMSYYSDTGFRNGYSKGSNSYQIDNQLTNGYMSNSSISRSLISYSTNSPYYPYTSSEGDGKGHTHGADATTNSHNHITDVIPPYYILAFIIKL